MVRRSSLCAECTQGLQESYAIPEPDEAVYSEYYKVSRNQTVETFRRAAEDGCFVCRTIWNQTEEHSRSWESVEASAWVGLSYIFWHFDYMSKKIFLGSLGFSVTYLDPISQSLEDTTFELVPTCCMSCGPGPRSCNHLQRHERSDPEQAPRSRIGYAPNGCKTAPRRSRLSIRPLLGTRSVYPATKNAKAGEAALPSATGSRSVWWMSAWKPTRCGGSFYLQRMSGRSTQNAPRT